jgi:hypothetical protein
LLEVRSCVFISNFHHSPPPPPKGYTIYKLLTWVTLLDHAESVCFKSVIQSGCSLFLSKIKKNTSLKLTVGVSPLQLINLHRNRRYFVIKLHTWFCLIFLEDKHKILLHLSIFYEYQQFFQHRICFPITNETSHVTTHATHSDPWPTLARSTSLFLICCYKYKNLKKHKLNILKFFFTQNSMVCECIDNSLSLRNYKSVPLV